MCFSFSRCTCNFNMLIRFISIHLFIFFRTKCTYFAFTRSWIDLQHTRNICTNFELQVCHSRRCIGRNLRNSSSRFYVENVPFFRKRWLQVKHIFQNDSTYNVRILCFHILPEGVYKKYKSLKKMTICLLCHDDFLSDNFV